MLPRDGNGRSKESMPGLTNGGIIHFDPRAIEGHDIRRYNKYDRLADDVAGKGVKRARILAGE